MPEKNPKWLDESIKKAKKGEGVPLSSTRDKAPKLKSIDPRDIIAEMQREKARELVKKHNLSLGVFEHAVKSNAVNPLKESLRMIELLEEEGVKVAQFKKQLKGLNITDTHIALINAVNGLPKAKQEKINKILEDEV
jgi:hypothetical protein